MSQPPVEPSWIDEIRPPYGTVTGQYVEVLQDSDDEGPYPDVQPLNGVVTLTPTAAAGRLDDVLAQISPVRLRIFGGQIVDAQDQPGVRVLSTDADLGVAVQDWAWTAHFQFDSGLRLKPLTFKVPAGETVNLTSGVVPVESVPYQVVQGEQGFQGASIVDVEQTAPEAMRVLIADPATGEEKASTITLPSGPEGPYGGTAVTDPQVASYIGAPTATTAALDRAYRRGHSVREYGAKGDGIADDTLAIQACADAAAGAGGDAVVYFPEGTYRTTGTVTLTGGVDGTAATILYEGGGVAVQLGSTSEVTFRRSMRLPKIDRAKSGAGWASGTVGILAVNLNTCSLYVPKVLNFETGLSMYAIGQGNAYNTVEIGNLQNNKVNLLLDAGTGGWTNQNLFLGGRFSHLSIEGTAVPGVRHIKMANIPNPVNNNLWLNPSVEGGTPEHHVEFAGTANMVVNGRWESPGGASVLWAAGSNRNIIDRGYSAFTLRETWEPGASPTNAVITSGGHEAFSTARALEAIGGNASPVEVLMETGATVNGSDKNTAWAVSRSALSTRMKRAGDQHPRVEIDHSNGRILVGNGASAPAVGLGSFGLALRLDARTQTTAPSSGSAAALPSAPSGYMEVYVGGAIRHIPYY